MMALSTPGVSSTCSSLVIFMRFEFILKVDSPLKELMKVVKLAHHGADTPFLDTCGTRWISSSDVKIVNDESKLLSISCNKVQVSFLRAGFNYAVDLKNILSLSTVVACGRVIPPSVTRRLCRDLDVRWIHVFLPPISIVSVLKNRSP
jgi:hypothetical protein